MRLTMGRVWFGHGSVSVVLQHEKKELNSVCSFSSISKKQISGPDGTCVCLLGL